MTTRISEDELLHMIKSLHTQQRNVTDQQTDLEPAEIGRDGYIHIENNKLIVKDPDEGGACAIIEPRSPVVISINGVSINEPTPVRESDKLEWEIKLPPLYRIEVSPDHMSAYFHLHSTVRYDWLLKDKPPQNRMHIEASEDRSTILETVQLSNVVMALQKMAIIKNLKPSAIYQELQNPTYEPILVASGVPPTPSVDARLELYFSEQIESNFHEIAGVVDYRNHLQIPSVKKGDLIAKKIPLVEGSVGYDIYGEFVKPAPPKDIIIMAKDHVEINSNGEVFATKEGRPRITGQKIKTFDICTSYIVSGNVDMKTGHIVFSGDVIVYGDVLDGMIIESLGNVYISGNVYKATITATGSITIKGNALGSNLYSGYFGVVFNRLYSSTKRLSEMLRELVEASKMLLGIIESKGKTIQIGQIIMTMIENKYKDIPQTVREILTSISNIQMINSEELKDLKDKLELLLFPLKIAGLTSFSYIYSIQNMIQETFQSIERMQESSVIIEIAQCHLSNVKSNGDILVRREGVLQSNLYAKGSIIFFGYEAVCRGSQLEAGDTICAMLVGGETGVQTLLKAGKKVTLKKVNNAKIGVGKFWRDFFEPAEHLVLRTNGYELLIERDKVQTET